MAYIDRDKAIAYVEEQYRLFEDDECKQAIVEGCVEALKFTPIADFVEVRHGRWIKRGNEKKCSVCGFIYYSNNDEWNGCPNCLAKMDGGKI